MHLDFIICILKIDWNQEYLWYEKIVVSVIDSNLVFGHACNWVYNIQKDTENVSNNCKRHGCKFISCMHVLSTEKAGYL